MDPPRTDPRPPRARHDDPGAVRAWEPVKFLLRLAGRGIGAPGTSVTFVAAFVLGALRRPDAILQPRFFVEDSLFFDQARQGLPLWEPFAGYLHIPSRLIAALQAPLDPTFAALVGTIIALLVAAGVATFVASDRLRSTLPDPALRLAVGLVVILIPAGGEPLGAPSHVQWYFAVFLVARLFADAPRSVGQAWAERVAVMLAALSSPVGIVLAPLYWLRARPLFPWLAIPAAVQLALVLSSGRSPGGYSLPLLIDILALRAIDQSIVGKFVVFVADWRLVVAVGLLGLLALGLRAVPRRLWLPGAYTLTVPLAFGLAGNPDRTAIMLSPWAAQRYFVIVGFVLAAAILLAVWNRRGPSQVALVALLACGLIASFGLAPRP